MLEAQRRQNFVAAEPLASLDPPLKRLRTDESRPPRDFSPAAGAGAGASEACGVGCTMMICSSRSFTVSSSPTQRGSSSPSATKIASGCRAPAVTCSICTFSAAPVSSAGRTSSYTSSSAPPALPGAAASAMMLTISGACWRCTTWPSLNSRGVLSSMAGLSSSSLTSRPKQVGTAPWTARWPLKSAAVMRVGTETLMDLVSFPWITAVTVTNTFAMPGSAAYSGSTVPVAHGR
mmetsp:Transcript_86681/g.245806  ORF Transcript_86681/g.245806 Transcript_86681/m.245806 type:complete len:234 (-) Transcript_86681:110-811(-)